MNEKRKSTTIKESEIHEYIKKEIKIVILIYRQSVLIII